MKIKVEITLTDDEYTEKSKEIQVQIEESIPEGFQNLDQWEQDVRMIGFESMRELFKQGIKLFEEKVLSEYTHKNKQCHMVKRGKRENGIWGSDIPKAKDGLQDLRRMGDSHQQSSWLT